VGSSCIVLVSIGIHGRVQPLRRARLCAAAARRGAPRTAAAWCDGAGGRPRSRVHSYQYGTGKRSILARGSASRRAGSCGRPRRFALLFLCPASAGKRATAPVQPLSAKPNSVAVPSDTPANGWPSFALRKWTACTQSRVQVSGIITFRVHCQNAGQCAALRTLGSSGRTSTVLVGCDLACANCFAYG
jgi:hypothetical protein